MRNREDGYAMAALLAAMASMAIMLSAAMPVWKTTAIREKEAELIFRGEEYVRAIGRFQRRMGPGTLPPSIDALVDGKFLRKKYKDPITNDDFQVLSAAQAAGVPGGQGGRGQTPQQLLQQAAGRVGGGFQLATPGGGGGFQLATPTAGGIIGVVSKSTDTSFRIYNNRQRYNEWTFVFTQQALAPGQGGVNQGQPGPRGGQPGPRGGFGGRGGVDGRGNPAGRGQNPTGQGANPFGGQQPPPPPPRPSF